MTTSTSVMNEMNTFTNGSTLLCSNFTRSCRSFNACSTALSEFAMFPSVMGLTTRLLLLFDGYPGSLHTPTGAALRRAVMALLASVHMDFLQDLYMKRGVSYSSMSVTGPAPMPLRSRIIGTETHLANARVPFRLKKGTLIAIGVGFLLFVALLLILG